MSDSHALASSFDPLFEPPDFNPQRGRVFLLLPAMGVAASFYAVFAQRLSERARAVVAVADLRGQGRSVLRA